MVRESEKEGAESDNYIDLTDIHVGELRKGPVDPEKPECYRVAENGTTLYNRIFEVRACLDARNKSVAVVLRV